MSIGLNVQANSLFSECAPEGIERHQLTEQLLDIDRKVPSYHLGVLRPPVYWYSSSCATATPGFWYSEKEVPQVPCIKLVYCTSKLVPSEHPIGSLTRPTSSSCSASWWCAIPSGVHSESYPPALNASWLTESTTGYYDMHVSLERRAFHKRNPINPKRSSLPVARSSLPVPKFAWKWEFLQLACRSNWKTSMRYFKSSITCA